MAGETDDAQRKAELREMARICRKVPQYPAESFREALQSFWFTFRGQRLYGKINLVDGGVEIVVYSAHRPLKGDEL